MKRTGLVWDDLFVQHLEDGLSHPESPERLRAIYAMLRSEKLDNKTVKLPLRNAIKEEILYNHSEQYYEQVASTKGKKMSAIDSDTWLTAKTFEAAIAAAGSGISLVDAIMDNEIDNGYLLERPPGHHAVYGSGMGFCIFNNVAIAADHLIRKHGLKKVAIVDYDVHHGNGTQDSFYERGNVLYCSTHQSPHFPGTGRLNETGHYDGAGYTVNIPLLPGLGDLDYGLIYENVICPIVEEYEPDFLLVSTGYDIHKNDPLSGMQVSTKGIASLSQMLIKLADKVCDGKIAYFLEGGYDTEALANSVSWSVRTLLGDDKDLKPVKHEMDGSVAQEIISQAKPYLEKKWDSIKNLKI